MRRQRPVWLRTPQSKRVVEPDGPLDNPLIGLVDIADPRREREVIDAVAMEAAARGIDPDYVSAVFRDQIDATVALEHNRIAHWKRNPNAAPAEVQELSACRAIIDALNRTLVHEIALRWKWLHSPTRATLLTAAKRTVINARHLDQPLQDALALATQKYGQ